MEGDEVETEVLCLANIEQGHNPVFVESGGGRSAYFVIGIGGTGGDSSSGLSVESQVIGVFAVVPGAKEIGFIPNFIINA